MRKLRCSVVCLLLTLNVCLLLAGANAQPGSSVPISVIQQLLDKPSISFSVSRPIEDSIGGHPKEFFSEKNPPKDDAPIEDLVDYWVYQVGNWEWAPGNNGKQPYDGPKPSAAVRQRFLDETENNPTLLNFALPWLQDSPQAQQQAKRIIDSNRDNALYDSEMSKAEDWLRLNSSLYVDDLEWAAAKVKDGGVDVQHEEELRALAKVDWQKARPILENLAGGDQPGSAVLATSLLYQHIVETQDTVGSGLADQYRSSLRAVVQDQNATLQSRDIAANALVTTEWSGRDDWYLSLVNDGTMWDLLPGQPDSPLLAPVVKDPDKWIPIMTELVNNKVPEVRNCAVTALSQFTGKKARKDAITPLLPWLFHPEWSRDFGSVFINLIQNLENIQIPEAVPGLISSLNNETTGYYAARVLAKYKDRSAGAALKSALAASKQPYVRPQLARAVIECGGATENEMIDDLESFLSLPPEEATKFNTFRADPRNLTPVPVSFSIGGYIAKGYDAPDSFSRKVLNRVYELQEVNPVLANRMLETSHRWHTHSVDVDMIRRIEAGKADAATIDLALNRRSKLRETASDELVALTDLKGINRAIGLVLIDDDQGINEVLYGRDGDSILAILACSRLAGKTLPIDAISSLFQRKDAKLISAAEHYLEAEDNAEARAFLWSRHPRQAWIVGWRPRSSNGKEAFASSQREKRVREEILREGAPDEILTMFPDFEIGEVTIRIRGSEGTVTYVEDKERYKERQLSDKEMQKIREFVATNESDSIRTPYMGCSEECKSDEILEVRRDGGWRLSISSGSGNATPLAMIKAVNLILNIASAEGYKTGYSLSSEINGLEVLIGDDKNQARGVWKRGNDLLVLIEKPSERVQQAGFRDRDKDEAESQSDQRKLQLKGLLANQARFKWHSYAYGKLGDIVDKPAEFETVFETINDGTFSIDPIDFPVYQNQNLHRATVGNTIVLAKVDSGGLWKMVDGKPPVQVKPDGRYSSIVAVDRNWAVALKTTYDQTPQATAVRVNLQTGKEYPVEIVATEPVIPIIYLDSIGKVLVSRATQLEQFGVRDNSDTSREFMFLDPSTGRLTSAKGEFWPLQQSDAHLLQPTGQRDEFWAARFDKASEVTVVGRYNIKTFSFQRVMTVKSLSFTSSDMWVDEAKGKIYVVHKGDLLRLSLVATDK